MKESIFVLASVAVFAVIGMLTGYLHGHGEDAGTVCGGLGGLILAIVVPSMLGTSFMTNRKILQDFVAVIALVLLLVIVCQMYNVVGRYWPSNWPMIRTTTASRTTGVASL